MISVPRRNISISITTHVFGRSQDLAISPSSSSKFYWMWVTNVQIHLNIARAHQLKCYILFNLTLNGNTCTIILLSSSCICHWMDSLLFKVKMKPWVLNDTNVWHHRPASHQYWINRAPTNTCLFHNNLQFDSHFEVVFQNFFDRSIHFSNQFTWIVIFISSFCWKKINWSRLKMEVENWELELRHLHEIFERESIASLRKINRYFLASGQTMDDNFRPHFLETSTHRYFACNSNQILFILLKKLSIMIGFCISISLNKSFRLDASFTTFLLEQKYRKQTALSSSLPANSISNGLNSSEYCVTCTDLTETLLFIRALFWYA